MIERRFCHHDPVEYEYEYEYRCTEYEYDCPDELRTSHSRHFCDCRVVGPNLMAVVADKHGGQAMRTGG